jgi:hypothetical protein
MTDRNRSIAGSGTIILSTLPISILLAVIRKGPGTFASISFAYMFVVFCAAGAVFYSVLKYRGPRDMIFTVFIVTLVHLLVFKVTEPGLFIELFLYYAALGASVMIYYRSVVLRLARIRLGKFVALAVIIVVLYSAVTIIVSLFSSGRSLSQSLAGIVTVHSLTGIALGLGLEIGEMLADMLFPAPPAR